MRPEFAPWRELGAGRIARDQPHGHDPRQRHDPGRRHDPRQRHDPQARARITAGAEHPTVADIECAAARIAPHVLRTPVAALEISGLHALGKLEAQQLGGSCKRRGAANRLLTLSPEERAAGVVTASSGNHARAVAELAAELGIRATVCVPAWTDTVKLEAIRASGATIRDDADSYDGAARLAGKLAAAQRLSLVPAFDDREVIAGQGTVGLELCEQAPGLDAVLIPLSGGGLCAGVALAFQQRSPCTRLIGVSAVNASVLYRCLLAGRRIQVEEQPTIASALSGGLGDHNQHTLAIVAELLDEVWLVSEAEICRALVWGNDQRGVRIEGGAAAALAPLLRDAPAAALAAAGARVPGVLGGSRAGGRGGPPRVGVILTGGNIDDATLARAREVAPQRAHPPYGRVAGPPYGP